MGRLKTATAMSIINCRSVVPSGLCNIVFRSIPSDESLGYFQMSRWDKRLRQRTRSARDIRIRTGETPVAPTIVSDNGHRLQCLNRRKFAFA
jgi:hypothetical protein